MRPTFPRTLETRRRRFRWAYQCHLQRLGTRTTRAWRCSKPLQSCTCEGSRKSNDTVNHQSFQLARSNTKNYMALNHMVTALVRLRVHGQGEARPGGRYHQIVDTAVKAFSSGRGESFTCVCTCSMHVLPQTIFEVSTTPP